MAAGLALGVAQTLFTALDCSVLKDICAMFGYKSQFVELKGTVLTIRAVLLDAEAKQDELFHEARDWVDKLKDALYDADDLIADFNTLTMLQQQQQNEMIGNENKFLKKVRRFFSRSNGLIVAFYTSLDIKKLRKKLDTISKDHRDFGLSVRYEPKRMKREETTAYVGKDRIVGRDRDKEDIVELLLGDSNAERNISFVTIVGMGGLGKTALAQLVYNDDRIQSTFQLGLWVCVSQDFGMKEILNKMMVALGGASLDHQGQLLNKVGDYIKGKRYFLVLDDVWNETRAKWVDLHEFLDQGGRGSRILVTSRSKLVAKAIGINYPMHGLRGLSKEDSWRLFRQMAFEKGEEPTNTDLEDIGKDIVKKCAYVPLSIRVIGSLLYGQDRSFWMSFKNCDKFPRIKEDEDDTMAVLKVSYHNLSPSLKSCFSYCALFPKDHAISKDKLISLWLAHGCVEPPEGQSIDDVAENHFSILLNRCFFQDTTMDKYGEISSFKIHDLMHDLAQKVAGSEMKTWPSTSQLDRKVRHLSIVGSHTFGLSDCPKEMKMMRTFLQAKAFVCLKQSAVTEILSECRHLRVLDLSGAFLKTLPGTIGKLIHLRYADLSHNRLEMLPESITKLHNLEILKLSECYELKSLPNKLSRLINLRTLDISECRSLTYMPEGMRKFTLLRTLKMFVVGEASSKEGKSSELEDLKALVNLRDQELLVKVRKLCPEEASRVLVREGGYLLNKPHLKTVTISLKDDVVGDVEEAVLEGLQPNDIGLKGMSIEGYKGEKWPSWASTMGKSFLCLMRIKLSGLTGVKHLPSLSQLLNLKWLEVEDIPKVVYMEKKGGEETGSIFFRSLKELKLYNLPELKGWWQGNRSSGTGEFEVEGVGCCGESGRGRAAELSFPHLSKLCITSCPKMTQFPSCTEVKEMTLHRFNKALSFGEKRGVESTNLSVSVPTMTRTELPEKNTGCSSSSSDNWGHPAPVPVGGGGFVLRELEIDNMGYLDCLPEKSLQALTRFKISGSSAERLSTGRRLCFQRCASSIQGLRIYWCNNLKSIGGSGGLEHLTNLHSLYISFCMNLTLEDYEEGFTWKSLQTSLSFLSLSFLPKLENLPEGMQYLTALQSLTIQHCENLIALPEWVACLSSLQYLQIGSCPRLQLLPEAMRHSTSLNRLIIQGNRRLIERCRAPDGKDYPKIQHIRHVDLND